MHSVESITYTIPKTQRSQWPFASTESDHRERARSGPELRFGPF
jgi:hypothetical protein